MGDRAREGWAYGNLGNSNQSKGDFSKAIEYHEQHLAIAKEAGRGVRSVRRISCETQGMCVCVYLSRAPTHANHGVGKAKRDVVDAQQSMAASLLQTLPSREATSREVRNSCHP